PVLSAAPFPAQNSGGIVDHLPYDVSGRANVANDSHPLADEYGGGVEVLCSDSLFECVQRVRQRCRQLGLVAMPPVEEGIAQRPRRICSGPIQPPHNVIDLSAKGVVSAGLDGPLVRSGRNQGLWGRP